MLTLLVRVPNFTLSVGNNREAFVPNPSANSPLELQMFEFIGKLMGIAIRNKEYLNLTLPPLFWKRVVGEEVRVVVALKLCPASGRSVVVVLSVSVVLAMYVSVCVLVSLFVFNRTRF